LAIKKQRVFCPLEQLYSCMHNLIIIHGYGLKRIYTFQVQPISGLDHGRKTFCGSLLDEDCCIP
jgi:hypothetical protein